MSTSTLTRRAAIAALGAMTLAAVAASHGALARSTLPRPGIRVDVAPLAANAGEPTAGWVAQYLPGQIAQNLARRGVSANVFVRIDYLTLGPNSGANGPAGSSYDNDPRRGDDQRRRDAGPGDVELLSHASKTTR